MAAPARLSAPKVLLSLLLVQLTLASCPGPIRCDEEETGAGDEGLGSSIFERPRDEALNIDGFRVDAALVEAAIDDSLRSKSEREHESAAAESSSTRHPLESVCPYGYFTCNNGECIAPRWRCDGHYDCDDFSDELNCTTLDLPQHGSIALPSSTTYRAPPPPPPPPPPPARSSPSDGPLPRPSPSLGGVNGATPLAAVAGANAVAPPPSAQVYGLDFNSTIEPLMIFSTGASIRGFWMKARIYFDIVVRSKARAGGGGAPATQSSSITDAFSLFFGMFGADAQTSPNSAIGSTTQPGGGKSTAADAADPLKPDNTIVGLDMDPNSREVFWVELGKEPGVYSAVLEDEQFEARHRRRLQAHKKVVEFGLLSPEDIALDTVAKNAYITDAGLPALVVCSYVHVNCKILQQEQLHKPRAIIADSATGWVTFTDWGDRPGIYLQSMDGRRFETLINTDVVWPNGLAADQAANQLYWADARLNKIEQVDLATGARRIIIKETSTNPFSVSQFEGRIYWSDWSKNEIKTCNKQTGNGTQVLMHADDIYGIHIYHPELARQETADVSNPCWSKHCSHLCLLSPASNVKYSASRRRNGAPLGASCACPDSMALSVLDKATCYEVELTFLLINVRNYVAQVYPERIGLRVVEEIVYSREHAIQDIATDWHNYRLFFFDAAQRKIYVADFSARAPTFENVTSLSSNSIRGLLFDASSSNLYWLEPDAGSLVIYSTRGHFGRTLRTNLDQPTSMVLDQRNRLLYVACLGRKPQIIRLDVTGSEQSQLLLLDRSTRDGFGLPVALHLDEQAQRLYWADAHLETIESVELDAKSRASGLRMNSRTVHKRRLGTILSFALYHDSFLWTIQNDGYLYKAKIQAKKGARPLVFRLPANPSRDHLAADYKRIITVNPLFDAPRSACHSAACSHGCILDANHAAKCLCPDAYKLSLLNRTNCIEQTREEATPAPAPERLLPLGQQQQQPAVAVQPASLRAHEQPAPLHFDYQHRPLDQAAHESPERPSTNAANKLHHEQEQLQQHEHMAAAAISSDDGKSPAESNRVLWLIVFLLILSAGAVVTVLSLLVLHRQGRLPRQVSVSFISPGSSLGGSRAADKDRAMLLLDTDN